MVPRSTFRVSSFAVWLLVVVLLCAALAPGVAVAKLERVIDTEGDPLDGVEGQGSSGGNSTESDLQEKLDVIDAYGKFMGEFGFGYLLIPQFVWKSQQLELVFVIQPIEVGGLSH